MRKVQEDKYGSGVRLSAVLIVHLINWRRYYMRRFTGIIFAVLSMMLLAACGGTREPVTYTSLEQLQDLNGGNLPVTERDAEGHITSFEGIISDFKIENEEQARLAFEGVLTPFL